ncbi:MAG: hypothetical protein CVU50_05760 [Candidatus Cloacimonetes bacterium HGW-Cloacimonetes-3]|jgi:hypothetical protein|nr:MAG: hypothetical protein CVU50_05760 [Candidatus Cloacimonetes bacterium HGW-Cloacimonetes-3]
MKHIVILLLILLPIIVFASDIRVDIPLIAPNGEINQNKLTKLGYGAVSSPGKLQLPVQNVNILLPPEAKIDSWSVNISAPQSLSGKAPAHNGGFSNGDKLLSMPESTGKPASYTYLGLRKWGDLRYAAFSVLPAFWDGNTWQWSNTCSIRLQYSSNEESGTIPSTFTDNTFFANPQDLQTWYSRSTHRNYDVLVIGTPALYAAMDSWVSFRQSQGLVISFTDIATALAQGMGTSDAEKLRSYLISQYQANNFTYLLLLGDYDTVPVAYLTPEPEGWDSVPSDFFYSDLSSNWDSDNDALLGEYSTGFMNQDYEVDFTPEVFVGRISTNIASQVTAIANRIVSYEQSTAPWKEANLLPAAFLNYGNEPEIGMLPTDGADFMQYAYDTALSGQLNFRMYEQMGVVPSYLCEMPLSSDNFRTLLDNYSWGFINWSAHGSSSSSSRKVWIEDSNEDGIPDSNEMSWMGLVNRGSFDNLANTDGAMIFAASCYNGLVDGDEPSLAEYALIKKAVAVLAATRTGWYKIGWQNPGWGGLSSFNYHYLENFRQAEMSVGASYAYANLLHTRYYLFGDPIDSDGIIWPELQNVYTYMLFGDPLIGYTPTAPMPQGEILVWEPNGQQGLAVVNSLREIADVNVIYTDKLIDDYDYINQFKAVFCLFGFGEANYNLETTSFEHNLLNSYLETGGKLYIEGDLNWSPLDSPFWTKLGVHAPLDNFTFIETVHHPLSNIIWQYADYTYPTQILFPFTETANVLFTTQNMDPPDANIGIWNSNGNYRTIASSFSLAQITPLRSNLADMLGIICDTLNVFVSSPSGAEDENLIPSAISLSSFPNPSRSLVTFSYSLPKANKVSMDIYNLKGQKVRSLSDAYMDKGEHSLVWDGKDASGKQCASGIYLYHFQAGKHKQSGKQVLIHK